LNKNKINLLDYDSVKSENDESSDTNKNINNSCKSNNKLGQLKIVKNEDKEIKIDKDSKPNVYDRSMTFLKSKKDNLERLKQEEEARQKLKDAQLQQEIDQAKSLIKKTSK